MTRTQQGLRMAAATVAVLIVTTTAARAEGLFTGFVGSTFGGEVPESAATYGFALGATAAGIFGVEFDLATSTDAVDIDPSVTDSSVTTAMGNLIVGVGGPVRPYVTGGAGLIRSRLDTSSPASLDQNDFGVNVGAGIIGFFTDNVGIRGDLRYFRAVGGDDDGDLLDFDFELGTLDFWRGSVGIAFRW